MLRVIRCGCWRLISPHVFLWIELRGKVLRLLLIFKIFIALTLLILFVVSRVQTWPHRSTSDLMIQKLLSMRIVVCILEYLSRIIILHAEAIVVVVHGVIKWVQVILAHYLRLWLPRLLLLIHIFSIRRRQTRATGPTPEITIDLFWHLVSTRGSSPSSSRHYRPLEVKVPRHQCI